MSSYSNYLGSKKCCANNLYQNSKGPQGEKGDKGPIGPFGHQGFTGPQGLRGVTGACCRGPPGVTGHPGITGAQGSDGAAGGVGGLPLFLNYSINGTTNTPSGIGSSTNAPLTFIPAIQAVTTSSGGVEVIYSNNAQQVQDFMTTFSPSIYPLTIPAGFYSLILYAWSASPGWEVEFRIYTCNSSGTPITPISSWSAAVNVSATSNPPTAVIIPHVGSSTTLNSPNQLLLRVRLTPNLSTSDLYINSEHLTGSNGYSILQTTFSASGSDGATGVTGAQGAQGVTGDRGFQGYTGSTGPQGAPGVTGLGGALGSYGSFGSTATMGVTGIGLTSYLNNLYVDGAGNTLVNVTGSQKDTLLINSPGTYNVQFSAQYDGPNNKNIFIWIVQNGINVPFSNTTIHTSGGGSPLVAAWNWFITTTSPNETIKIAWTADDLGITIYSPVATYGPNIPSVIVTIQQVMYTQVGVTGAQGSTGHIGATGLSGTLLPNGSYWSDYLYWDNSTNSWTNGGLPSTIHIGNNAGGGAPNQGSYSIAIGNDTASDGNQQNYSIAIGPQCASNSQQNESIALGHNTALNNQQNEAIAIGHNAALNNQNDYSIAIGSSSGYNLQSSGCIAIGHESANNNQSTNSISIGRRAGYNSQQSHAIAIGYEAGFTGQSDYSVAIGYSAAGGLIPQSTNGVAIGNVAGYTNQGLNSVAIGYSAGNANQAQNSVAIGYGSGASNQGSYSVALGYEAGFNIQEQNTIIINAQSSNLDGISGVSQATYVAPVRNSTVPNPSGASRNPDYFLTYDPSFDASYNPTGTNTYEVSWGRHGMLLATQYLPYSATVTDWYLHGASGISQSLSTSPFNPITCQSNNYSMFLCSCASISLIGPILSVGTTCYNSGALLVGQPCDGFFALLLDPTGDYDEAAYFYIYLRDAIGGTANNFCNMTWSASIEWLQDNRSSVTISGTTYKIMLLSSNHSF